MLLDQNSLHIIEEITSGAFAIDTETTGLEPYKGNWLFGIAVSNGEKHAYIDVGQLETTKPLVQMLNKAFDDSTKSVYMLNAKFDMAFLYKFGITSVTTPMILDCQVLARMYNNNTQSLKMSALAKLIGMEKSEQVKEWALANNSWRWIEELNEDTGKVEKTREILYHTVPVDIMTEYAAKDAEITYKLGRFLLDKLIEMDSNKLIATQRLILELLRIEVETTKTLYKMEREGALVDKLYIKDALEFSKKEYKDAAEEFERLSGIPFKDSGKVIGEAFKQHANEDKHLFRYTDTGKFCTKDEVLSKFKSPIALTVQRYRDNRKRATTYFQPYSVLADTSGRIHANFRQPGTRTARLSCAAPNLQNVTKGKDKESSWPIRRAFIPPPDFVWGSIDYQAMEYKLLLNYSGEPGLVKQVLAGSDLHDATASMMGVDRTKAKTINFGLLYGCGIDKLAEMLGCSREDAKRLKTLYFSKLPATGDLIHRVVKEAQTRGYIFNLLGRIYRFPDLELCYKAPNYLIQGGCADIVRLAMNEVMRTIEEKKCRSRLILQVHDALEFYIHKDEIEMLYEFQKIMESVYQYRHVPLTAAVEISEKSWADTEKIQLWLDNQKQSSQTK